MNFLHKNFAALIITLCLIAGVFGLVLEIQKADKEQGTLTPQMQSAMQSYLNSSEAHGVSFGATQPIAGQTYNLSGAGVSGSATTINLTSLTIKQTGQPILTTDLVGGGGIFYVTIEPGSNSTQEIVGCTGVSQNGTSASLTGCTRGLMPIYPYTASTTMQFTHSGGSQVIFSDPPQLFQQYLALATAATSTNILVFSSTTPPRYDEPGAQAGGNFIATTSELASVAYVNAVTTSGAPNATISVKGIVQLGTALQVASSTSIGSTGAALVVQSANSTDTPQLGCAAGHTATAGAGCNVVADLTGHVRQTWLDLTQLFNFSNLQSASSTFSGNVYIGGNATSTNNFVFSGPVLFTGAVTGLAGITTTAVAGQTITAGQIVNILPFPTSNITLDTTLQYSVTGSTNTQSFTVAANSNRALIVDVVTGGANVSTITYGGVSMTGINNASITGSTNNLDQYYLNAPATGTNNLVITLSGSQSINVIVYSYFNVAQSGQPEVKGVGTGSTASTISVTPLTNGSLVNGLTYCAGGGVVGGNVYTNNKVTNAGSSPMIAGDSGDVYPPSAQTMSCSGSGGNVASEVMSLAPVSTAATGRAYLADSTQSWTASSTIGIAFTTATVGNNVTVTTNGVATGLTSILPGTVYYVGATGALTTSVGLHKIGIGLTSTTLNIENIF